MKRMKRVKIYTNNEEISNSLFGVFGCCFGAVFGPSDEREEEEKFCFDFA